MNNKIIARIMAAVICVCMMSTVAFAADPTLTVDGDTATLSFVVGGEDITVSDEAQITMMAYLVDAEATAVPAYTNQTVIALDQVAGSEGFGNVSIAPSKLDGTSKIAVVVGGSNGETVSYLINQAAPAPVTYTATFAGEGVEIAAMAGNVAGATITLPAVPAKDGYTGVWNDGTTAYEGGATYTFGAADVTFTAVYTAITYTATFAGEGVSIEAMAGNAAGATITLPAVPAKDGYTGVWNDGTTDYEGGATYTFGAADVTFTAVYTEVPAVETEELVVGDVNRDTKVDGSDAAILLLYTNISARKPADRAAVNTANNSYINESHIESATSTIVVGDVNLDTKVDGSDAAILLLYTNISARKPADRAAVNTTNNSYIGETKTVQK